MVLSTAQRILDRFTSPLDVDAFLSTVHPLWGVRARGRIVSVQPRGVDAASVRIRPGAAWQGHRVGQFVTLGVDIDGVRHHRSFTLTSVPGDPLLEVTVQAAPGGVVAPHLVHDARPGEIVQLSPAAGGAERVERSPSAPMLFVAGGSGITPTVAVLRWLDRQGVDIDAVVLAHSVNAERALFAEELDELSSRHAGLEVVPVHSRADGSHRLTRDRLDQRCPDWRDRDAHVCGPESMLDAATSIWATEGIDDRLHVERFRPSTRSPRRAAPETPSSNALALFANADVVAAAPEGVPLLEVAESAGLTPANGCRMGICHTCTTRLASGCVTDLRDGRRRSEGEHVQLCVSSADGDVVLDL